jgi:hypothetical protein
MIYLSLLFLFFIFIQSLSYLTLLPKLRCHHMVSRTVARSMREEESNTLTKKPVILLDVDGVVNSESYERIWPDQKMVQLMGYKYIYYSPTIVDKINSWNKVANVKWLSYLNNDARDEIAPLIGLDRFENARFDKGDKSVPGQIRSAFSMATNLGDDGIVIWLDYRVRALKTHYSNYVDKSTNTNYGAIFQRPNTFLVKPLYAGMTTEHVAFVDSILNGSYDKMLYNPNETVCFPKGSFE